MTLLQACFELTKPRIVAMVLVAAALGFHLGGQGGADLALLGLTLLGTALTASGSGVLNHYLERDVDALMRRTRSRPLPAGEVPPSTALSLGFLLILGGQVVLVLGVNLLTAWLALLTAFLYVVVYTPLKRLTWLNTSLGSIPGALPPVGGWAAATGGLDAGAWVLFAILFAWQHPHFYAIAWIFREDYRRGGFRMLPVLEEDGRRTCRHILAFSLMLLAFSVLPATLGMSGKLYGAGALVLGLLMLAPGVTLARSRSIGDARRLLRASVLYLPLLFLLSIVDRGL
ncbi:MAG: heme o synthase [Gemmatimonadaceae bacterium]|nr:heme o synthase [Gemmatimonadaceae bacterium]